MNKEQILKKVIRKAVKNGWKGFPNNWTATDLGQYLKSEEWINLIIWKHDFAKAFWEEKPLNIGIELGTTRGEVINLENWQYHLQQMVLEKEPLKYLEKFL